MKKGMGAKNRLKSYLAWPLLLSVLVIAGNVAAAVANRRSMLAVLPFSVAYVIAAAWIYFYSRKKILGGLVEYSAKYAKIQKHLIMEMELPYALAEVDGRLLWHNRSFHALLSEEKKASRKNLLNIFPELTKEKLSSGDETLQVHTAIGGRNFRMDIQEVSIEHTGDEVDADLFAGDGSSFLAVCLFDETEILKCRKEVAEEKMVAGLIYLDNYEEALDSVEEVRRSLLAALIDRKINKYIGSIDGIVRKLEKDKYFFTIKQKYVEQIEEERFSILEDVKTVNIGNEMSVTLSIGIGMGSDSYIKKYEFARAAIDMALGRGGDQAVVKDEDKIQYYGGKSQQLEKATRVKARVKAHAMRELMETKDRILIMGHRLGDIDSFGASIGIYRIAASLNKRAHIVINEVTTSVQPMLNRFKGNPDYPDDLILTGAQAADLVDANTLLVVVDVNRPSITDTPELLRLVKAIIVLDHHRQSSEVISNAVLSYVEPYASSACEMVAEILQYIADDIKIRSVEADAMYGGIVIDTDSFKNQTGVRTFEAAAYLRQHGADITRVRKMFRDSMEENKARAAAVSSAEIYRDGFAIAECPSEGLTSPTVVGAQAANELLSVKGIRASVVLTMYRNTIFVSARSIDEINVQVMMEKLGGGGHRTIAGAQLADATIQEARQKVKAVIDEMTEKGEL